ncbi:nuclear transport factor 2 family protein [Streptococcus macacae]|uniref:SnoaL-like domain-containing protein n=1 Tax=Streptococcus macacae NCTC 11558 TaxID=764298 RepID=G5JUU0_9STRE|nr:nuclear transport factor 2 family protein [Streptococcus macacae]EHJ51693.1 hypothetical protein STRMA_1080 [Streptococcus macacae NCTC 11558]SUN78905.1 SnoaL-like domain [Streptococcus macacae NCTC 11558]
MNILDRYFVLSDLAGKDKGKLTELCHLFSENAIIEANDGKTYSGREEINPFFEKFFNKNSESKHLWDIEEMADGLQRANWAVVCRRKTGAYLALTGSDLARIKGDKIIYLKVRSDS